MKWFAVHKGDIWLRERHCRNEHLGSHGPTAGKNMMRCYAVKIAFKMVSEQTKKSVRTLLLEKFSFSLFSFLVFLSQITFLGAKWVKIWQPITQAHFQNVFGSGNSGSFKARMLTILLRTLTYDGLNIRKRKPWNDQRNHQEATLLKSSVFKILFLIFQRPQGRW